MAYNKRALVSGSVLAWLLLYSVCVCWPLGGPEGLGTVRVGLLSEGGDRGTAPHGQLHPRLTFQKL